MNENLINFGCILLDAERALNDLEFHGLSYNRERDAFIAENPEKNQEISIRPFNWQLFRTKGSTTEILFESENFDRLYEDILNASDYQDEIEDILAEFIEEWGLKGELTYRLEKVIGTKSYTAVIRSKDPGLTQEILAWADKSPEWKKGPIEGNWLRVGTIFRPPITIEVVFTSNIETPLFLFSVYSL